MQYEQLHISTHTLSPIQQELVARDIQKRGLEAVRTEIAQAPRETIHRDENGDCYFIPTVKLAIEVIIDKATIESDPLADFIFNTIEQVEAKGGYIPNQIVLTDRQGIKRKQSETNYLDSCGTRYYWLDEENRHQVRVSAKIKKEKALMEYIKRLKQ